MFECFRLTDYPSISFQHCDDSPSFTRWKFTFTVLLYHWKLLSWSHKMSKSSSPIYCHKFQRKPMLRWITQNLSLKLTTCNFLLANILMHTMGLISFQPVETLLSHSLKKLGPKKLQSDLDLYTFTFTVLLLCFIWAFILYVVIKCPKVCHPYLQFYMPGMA